MRDDRAVDEKLFNVVAEGGPLHDVVRFVKEHEELELCFRGIPEMVILTYITKIT